MGTYSAIGIVNKISFGKKDLEEMKMDIDILSKKIEEEFYFDLNIYDLKEDENKYTFNLKDSVIDSQLKPFLEEIYPHIYEESSSYLDILEKLDNLKSSEIIEFAKQKSKEAFQYDEYGHDDYIRGAFAKHVHISYDAILISMEGKTMMETYGKHFNFFKHTIIRAYPKYNISTAIRMYITG